MSEREQTQHLGQALLNTLKNDMIGIMKAFLKEDLVGFAKSNGRSLLSFISLPLLLKTAIESDGIKETKNNLVSEAKATLLSLKEMGTRIQPQLSTLYQETRQDLEELNSQTERSAYVIKLLSYLVSNLAGLLISSDINTTQLSMMSPRRYRKIIARSALVFAAATLTAYFLLRVIRQTEQYLHSNSEHKQNLTFIRKNLQSIVSREKLKEKENEINLYSIDEPLDPKNSRDEKIISRVDRFFEQITL